MKRYLLNCGHYDDEQCHCFDLLYPQCPRCKKESYTDHEDYWKCKYCGTMFKKNSGEVPNYNDERGNHIKYKNWNKIKE